VILIFSGLSIWSFASQRQVTWEIVESTQNEYSLSAPLNKDDKILVEIRQGANWSSYPFEISDDPQELPILWVIVDIHDPSDNATRFFSAYTPQNPVLLVRYGDIEITQQNGLDPAPFYDETTTKYNEIGGIVAYDGVYNVTIFDIFPRNPNYDPNSWRDPPSYLAIMREKIVTGNPSTHLFIAVGALLVGGSITLLVGFKSSKPKALGKRKIGVRR